LFHAARATFPVFGIKGGIKGEELKGTLPFAPYSARNIFNICVIHLQEFAMANNSISVTKIIGFALIVAGAGLAYWGYHLSGFAGARITQAVTGSATDEVTKFYLGGAASFIVGLYLFVTK
jgi:hypothetical protein